MLFVCFFCKGKKAGSDSDCAIPNWEFTTNFTPNQEFATEQWDKILGISLGQKNAVQA